jgi:hypothetical protein
MQPPLHDDPPPADIAAAPVAKPPPGPVPTFRVIEIENPEDQERLYQVIEIESETEIAAYPRASHAQGAAIHAALERCGQVLIDRNVIIALWEEGRQPLIDINEIEF